MKEGRRSCRNRKLLNSVEYSLDSGEWQKGRLLARHRYSNRSEAVLLGRY